MNDYTHNDTEDLAGSGEKPKRGRPAFKVEWPEVEFTAEEIYHALEKKLSRVSIHAKINKALGQGVLLMVGKIKPRTGRPKIVYKRAAAQQCQG